MGSKNSSVREPIPTEAHSNPIIAPGDASQIKQTAPQDSDSHSLTERRYRTAKQELVAGLLDIVRSGKMNAAERQTARLKLDAITQAWKITSRRSVPRPAQPDAEPEEDLTAEAKTIMDLLGAK